MIFKAYDTRRISYYDAMGFVRKKNGEKFDSLHQEYLERLILGKGASS